MIPIDLVYDSMFHAHYVVCFVYGKFIRSPMCMLKMGGASG